MSDPRRTAIVTGASQGIGAGIVNGFVERGFNVVANSRKVTQSTEVAASDRVALVDGHIGERDRWHLRQLNTQWSSTVVEFVLMTKAPFNYQRPK